MKLRRLVFLFLLLPILAGCLPDSGRVEDEKDPHYQEGVNLVNSQDYRGAMDEFEKALQNNPHSAAAHFQLALLAERQGDPAAAIYHYERLLQLRPDSPHAPTARERIRGCKEALATAEFPLPNSQNLQHEVDQLTAENGRLRQEVESLQGQLAARPTMVTPSAPAPAASIDPSASQAPAPSRAAPAPGYSSGKTASSSPAVTAPRGRVYAVRPGDTISRIAREHGMRPSALLAANPKVNPRRLRVGETLTIP